MYSEKYSAHANWLLISKYLLDYCQGDVKK